MKFTERGRRIYNMDFLALVDVLEEQITNAAKVPMSGKCMLDREEMIDIIRALRERIPEDIRQANWIKEERQKILNDAKKEANNILKEAENRFQVMIEDHEVTKKAMEQAKEIVETANRKAKEIRLGTRDYVDGILGVFETSLEEKLKVIREDRNSLK